MKFGKMRAKLSSVQPMCDGYKLVLDTDVDTGKALEGLLQGELCLFDGAEINRTVLLWVLLEHLAGKMKKDAAELMAELIDRLFAQLDDCDEIKSLYDVWRG